jgi:hypothetical protein
MCKEHNSDFFFQRKKNNFRGSVEDDSSDKVNFNYKIQKKARVDAYWKINGV